MKKGKQEDEAKDSKIVTEPKYSKPKILLIDLPPTVAEELRKIGFNASWGTFGSPYRVERGDSYSPVIAKADLPNYSEQEVIIIDLSPPEEEDGPAGDKMTSNGEYDWWAKESAGKIDPRPRVMAHVREDFGRILNHGGLFVIFAAPRSEQDILLAKRDRYSNSLVDGEKIKADNWSFLSILNEENLVAEFDSGYEITINDCEGSLLEFLRENLKNAHYIATVRPRYQSDEKSWKSLVLNKYGHSVGRLFIPEDHKARILILPQLQKNTETIIKLVKQVLPEISPHLFPDMEGQKWVHRPEYEHLKVLEIISKKDKIKQEAENQAKELDTEILAESQKLDFLHGILTQTGEELVKSVKKALEFIGFAKVDEIDEIERRRLKQEDLQIHKGNFVLLVEVKGLSGFPRQNDTLQVAKYIARRRKQLKHKEINGVSIINHQRNLPPLDRDQKNVFTDEQIDDAKSFDFTVLTTWDLFRLIRGMMKWGWDSRSIQRLFWTVGRMPCLPTIYEPIGKVRHYYDDIGVITVEISNAGLNIGQRIGYATESEFLEEDVISLELNNEKIEMAEPGQEIGLKTVYSKEQLRKNTPVYVLRNFVEAKSSGSRGS
jgi:hypothetical protein